MSAQIFPAVKGLQLVVEPPIDSTTGQVRDDLSGIRVWYSTQNNIDTTTAPQLQSDGLNVFIPNLTAGTLYYVKYALVSYLDEAQYNDSEVLQATPLSGAVAVDLSVGTQVFTYTAAGITPSPANTTITATARNTTGTVYYEFILAGITVQNTTTNSYTYTPLADHSNMPQQIVVKVREGSSNSTVLAQDTLTLIGVKPGINGIDAVSGFLTNESATVSTLSDGTGGVYTSAGGTFRVYSGITDVTASATYSVFTANTTGGLSISINTAGVYTVTALTDDSGTATLRAVYGTVTIEKIYSISKSKQGTKGDKGDEGDPGINARVVDLSIGTQVFTYNSSGASPSPTTTTITATARNTSGTVYYEFILAGTTVQNTTTNSYTYTPQSNHSSMPQQVVVKVREGSNNSTVLAEDTLSVIGVKPGVNGIDAVSGFLTNESATVSTLNDGTGGVYTSAGGTFKVYNGITDVTGAQVTYSVVSGSTTGGITISINTAGVYTVTALTDDSGTATLRAVYGTVTIEKIYSISKSKQGSKGDKGDEGDPGTRTAILELYRWGTSVPTTFPTGNTTYTWATGAFTTNELTLNGWSTLEAVGSGTATQTLYVIRQIYTDTSIAATSLISWASTTALAVGLNGTNGNPGTSGTWVRYVYAYKLVTRANTSTASVVPAAPTGGVFNIDTFALAPPDGWLSTQPQNTGGTVYVSRNRVGPTQAITGSINISGAWSTPVPASQILENGASYTYDVESNTSSYVPTVGSAIIYTKSGSTGIIPTTPNGGTFLFDIATTNTATAPIGWYTTIALLDASTLPAQNPVFQSSTNITTISDILSYTPTWSTPQYQFRSGGQISSKVINRNTVSRSFTTAARYTETLGSGFQPNSNYNLAFTTTPVLVSMGSSGRLNYSLNGGAHISVSGAPTITPSGMAASTAYMVVGGSIGNSTIYVNTLSSGIPTSSWTTVNLSSNIGTSSMRVYSIIKLDFGWLAVGETSDGIGRVIYCNNQVPSVGSAWSTVSTGWAGTGNLPGLRGVIHSSASGIPLTIAVGVNGTIIGTYNPPNQSNWQSVYGPGVGNIFAGSDSITINTIAASSTIISDGVVCSIAYNSTTSSSSRTFTIAFNTNLFPQVFEHPTISINDGTVIKIYKLLYHPSYGILFATTNQGLWVSNVTIRGTGGLASVSADTWRWIRQADGFTGTGSNISIDSISNVLITTDPAFNTTNNIYYYLGIPTSTELQDSLLRTTPQVGDAVTIQLNNIDQQNAINKNFSIGLRCTNSPGAANQASWTRIGSWIDGDMIVSGSITADSLAVNSIIAEKIQAGSITAEKLSANTALVNQSLTVGNPVVTGTTISSGSGAVITGGSTTSTNIVAFGNSSGNIVVKDGTINLNGKIVPPKNAAFGMISEALLYDITGPVGISFPSMAQQSNSTKLQIATTPTIYIPTDDLDKVFKIHIELNLHVNIRVELLAGYIGMQVIRTNISDGGVPPTTINGLNSNFDSIVSTTKTWSNQLTPWGEWPHNLITTLTNSLIESTTDPTRTFFQPIIPGKTYAYTVFLFAQLDNTVNTALYQTVQSSTIVGDSTYIPSQQYYPEYGQLFTTVSNVLPESYFPLTFYGSPTYSNILTVSGATANTNSLLRGMTVYGAGVPPRTVILSVLNSTQISLYTFTGDNFGNSGGYLPKIPGAVNAGKTYYFGPPLVTGLTADNVIVFGNWTFPAGTQPRFIWPKINSNDFNSTIIINPVGIYSGPSGSTIQLIGYYTQSIV